MQLAIEELAVMLVGVFLVAHAGSNAQPIVYREVTAPIGAVNPVTAICPARPAYPVPQCFTTVRSSARTYHRVVCLPLHSCTCMARFMLHEKVLSTCSCVYAHTDAISATLHIYHVYHVCPPTHALDIDYVVPSCDVCVCVLCHVYAQTKAFPGGHGDVTMDTVNRASFAPRSAEDVLRTMRASAEATARAKIMTVKTEIPLGKNGIEMLASKDWVSDHHANYRPMTTNVKEDRARAAACKAMMAGPTASAGRLTAVLPKRPMSVA